MSGAKVSLNAGVSIWGFSAGVAGMGVGGFMGGAMYFGIDTFYPGGWQGYGNDYDRLQKANQQITPGFITAPYGALKQ